VKINISEPENQSGFCDIHSHLLHGLDDGAKNLGQSIEGVKFLYELGYRRICLTPHQQSGEYEYDFNDIHVRLDELKESVCKEGIDIEFSNGIEYLFGSSFIDDSQTGKLITLGKSSYFLLEFETFNIQSFYKNLFFKLIAGGLKPILAHPERCDLKSVSEKEFFDYLVSCGALIQCGITSLTGMWGRKAADLTAHLIEKGRVSFFATDLHCRKADYHAIPEGIERLASLAGKDGLKKYLIKNPCELLLVDKSGADGK